MHVRSALLLLILTGGCVSSGTYNAKLGELEILRADVDQLQAQLINLASERDYLRTQYSESQRRVAHLERSLGEHATLTAERNRLRKSLDDTTALAGRLKERLEKLGQNVDHLTAERGQLAADLADARSRLEDLRKQKSAADGRRHVPQPHTEAASVEPRRSVQGDRS